MQRENHEKRTDLYESAKSSTPTPEEIGEKASAQIWDMLTGGAPYPKK